MATIKEDGALLSQYAYADKGIKVGDSVGQYIAVEVSYDSSNNFRGVLFQNTINQQYVLAFTGTDFGNELDRGTNLDMFAYNTGSQGVPDQFASAGVFTANMIDKYGLNASNTILVGHSEGGSEAMYFGATTGFITYTYNAYGVGNFNGIQDGSYLNIHNYVTYLDFVSRLPGSDMIGATTMVGDTTFADMAGHGITNFLDPNIWTTNVVNGITDVQNFGFWHDMGITVENAGKILTNLSDYLHLSDTSGLTDEDLTAALIMASVDGNSKLILDDGSIIYLASNSLNGLGNVISATYQNTNGFMFDQNSFFFDVSGGFLGNITSFDPENTLSPYTSISSVSDLLESFQQNMTLNSMEAAQIYSSMFSGSSSEFKDFLFYSWDDKYGDNDFWLEKQNDPIWTQYRNDSDIIWTTDDYMAAVAIYNDVYFGDYYHDVVNGTTNVPTDNTELIAYSDWSNNAGISFDGVSVNASYGSNGGGASFSISFSFPVVLDLDGDGVELTSVIDSKAWFDITGDGTMHQTGWVGADDGLLVFDENGDGKITTAREIAFADRTVADDTDLEALKTEFDSNNDGKLDAGDNEFGKFYIWQDKNSDGESDDGELLTLPQAGISSMDLIGSKIDPYMVDGNKINAFTTYIRTDGTVGMGADVALAYDNTGYTTGSANGYMTIRQTGSEAVYAMATSATPLVLNLSIAKLDGAIGNQGNDTLDANSKNTSVILEGLEGDDILKGGAGDDWLDGGEGIDTLEGGKGNDTYVIDNILELNNLKEVMFDNTSYRDTIVYNSSEDLKFDLSSYEKEIESFYSGAGNDVLVYSYNFETQHLYRYGGHVSTLFIHGGDGDDVIYGNNLNDLLVGGNGNDILNGWGGNDIYVFNRGDGIDTIAEFSEKYVVVKKHKWYQGTSSDKYGYVEANGGDDTIRFGEGIALDNIDIKLIDSDLLVGIRNAGDVSDIETLSDRILIKDFLNSFRAIENLSFADGTTVSLASISGLNIGTSSIDTIIGSAGSDIINSKAGADTLSGGEGNDVFIFDTVFSEQVMGLTKVATFGSLSRSTYGIIEKSNGNIDTISDFEAGKDIIYLDNVIFKKLTDGPLEIDNFGANPTGTALDANDYILYNTTTGTLSYDADGNDKGAAVVFATLANKTTDLSHQDFYVM
ncbi:MAG: calcium-binding protein [Sulfurovaceae bacterium]